MAAGHGSTTRAVQITVGQVGSIDFQGVPGKLTIVGTGPGQVTLTGQLHADGGAPVVDSRLDRAAGVLLVSVRCPPATQCTQDLRLAVPGDTGAIVRQPGGQVVVTGLAGPLRLTATNADIRRARPDPGMPPQWAPNQAPDTPQKRQAKSTARRRRLTSDPLAGSRSAR